LFSISFLFSFVLFRQANNNRGRWEKWQYHPFFYIHSQTAVTVWFRLHCFPYRFVFFIIIYFF
jgi:hypothetical protein